MQQRLTDTKIKTLLSVFPISNPCIYLFICVGLYMCVESMRCRTDYRIAAKFLALKSTLNDEVINKRKYRNFGMHMCVQCMFIYTIQLCYYHCWLTHLAWMSVLVPWKKISILYFSISIVHFLGSMSFKMEHQIFLQSLQLFIFFNQLCWKSYKKLLEFTKNSIFSFMRSYIKRFHQEQLQNVIRLYCSMLFFLM